MPLTPFLILMLLLAANGAPLLVARLCGSHWSCPVDFGVTAWDGRPLFGRSKTWRGVASAVVSATLVAVLVGYGPLFGLAFGALAMIGDLSSSFVKRRRGLDPSDQSLGWDQLLESLLPSLYATLALGAPLWWVLPVCAVFTLIGALVSVASRRG